MYYVSTSFRAGLRRKLGKAQTFLAASSCCVVDKKRLLPSKRAAILQAGTFTKQNMQSIQQEAAGRVCGAGLRFRKIERLSMSNLESSEVLIAGAGPVGMLTALILANNGIKVRIIDQESRTAGHSYSCALHPRSLEILHQVGLAADAVEMGRRVNSVGFYGGNERRAEVSFAKLRSPYPFALVLEQSALENLLEQKLRQAGVRIQWDHRLSNMEVDENGIDITLERLGFSGKGYGVPGIDTEVQEDLRARTQFVVGADGSNSLVRARLNIKFERIGPPLHYAVFELETAGGCDHEARVVVDEGMTSVLWPLSDTRCRWSFQVDPDEEEDDFPSKDRTRLVVVERPSLNDSAHRFQRFLRERAPWFNCQVNEIVWTAEVQFHPRLARQLGRNRAWLAGDAAHQTGPVGMQSMNMGFREAWDLAETLTAIIRKGKSRDLLRTYDRGRWLEWWRLLGFKSNSAASDAAKEWVRLRSAQIVGSIPASGDELTALLQQLNIDFHPAPAPKAEPAV